MDPLGIYVSIPFCKAKCTFCNFASGAFPPARMAAYVDRVCDEMAASKSVAQANGLRLPALVDSVFLGGGTPSLLEPDQLGQVFRTLRKTFDLTPDAEITVEAAPGQIAGPLLDVMLECGVNRVSLGVQSFVDAEASAVGRSHTGASCRAEIARLQQAGFQRLSVDLIAGLPHQTPESWATSLQQVVESGVEHVSVYMLEVDDDSRLGRELIGPGVRYGAHAAPGDALVSDFYAQACETLGRAGLQQYEISNFARDGQQSLHNRKYWTHAPYLGFGLDAHSMLPDVMTGRPVRFANGDDLETYVAASETVELDHVDALGAWEESIFLGLRLTEGISLSRLQQQHPAVWVEAFEKAARELQADGLMQIASDRVMLTQRGRIVSSAIFGELLAGAPLTMQVS